jgi:hypothetical protein
MAINRVVALYIGMAAALAFAVFVLPTLVCMWAPPYGITKMSDLGITEVQFEKDYLNITVENICTQAKTISEVTVSDLMAGDTGFIINQTSTPHTIPLHEPISAGEQISIRISFNWTSGHAYQIKLETADTTDESPAALCVETAP